MFIKIACKEDRSRDHPDSMHGSLPLSEWDEITEMVIECERFKTTTAKGRIMISVLVRRHTIETATGYDWDSLELPTKDLRIFFMNNNGKTFDSLRWD